ADPGVAPPRRGLRVLQQRPADGPLTQEFPALRSLPPRLSGLGPYSVANPCKWQRTLANGEEPLPRAKECVQSVHNTVYMGGRKWGRKGTVGDERRAGHARAFWVAW